MSDPCRRPIQTDRHGHPPKGVSSCPVGEIGGEVADRSALPLLTTFLHSSIHATMQRGSQPIAPCFVLLIALLRG